MAHYRQVKMKQHKLIYNYQQLLVSKKYPYKWSMAIIWWTHFFLNYGINDFE